VAAEVEASQEDLQEVLQELLALLLQGVEACSDLDPRTLPWAVLDQEVLEARWPMDSHLEQEAELLMRPLVP